MTSGKNANNCELCIVFFMKFSHTLSIRCSTKKVINILLFVFKISHDMTRTSNFDNLALEILAKAMYLDSSTNSFRIRSHRERSKHRPLHYPLGERPCLSTITKTPQLITILFLCILIINKEGVGPRLKPSRAIKNFPGTYHVTDIIL